MVPPQNQFSRKQKASPHDVHGAVRSPRSGRHDRLRDFARVSREITQLYRVDPKKGAALFSKSKKAFLREGWTLNHFRSPESLELLIQLNMFFRGRDGAPPVESAEEGKSLRPLAATDKRARQTPAHNLKRRPLAEERSWKKDPRIIIIFAVLAFLFVFFVALFLGPVPSDQLIPIQPFQP